MKQLGMIPSQALVLALAIAAGVGAIVSSTHAEAAGNGVRQEAIGDQGLRLTAYTVTVPSGASKAPSSRALPAL